MKALLLRDEHGYSIKVGNAQAGFDSLNEAMDWVNQTGADVFEKEILLGFQLGAFCVEITEGMTDLNKVIAALDDSTDPAWSAGARALGEALIAWADRSER